MRKLSVFRSKGGTNKEGGKGEVMRGREGGRERERERERERDHVSDACVVTVDILMYQKASTIIIYDCYGRATSACSVCATQQLATL